MKTKTPFLTTQLSDMLRSFKYRKQLWLKLYLLINLKDLFICYLKFIWQLNQPRTKSKFTDKTCVVVLLSHNRPHNMNILVKGALHQNFVSKVIVSNSNINVRITDWIKIKDSRLVLIDETIPTQPGHRFVIADRENSNYFLSIDDDILLMPNQWVTFFDRLVADDEVTHCLTGNVYLPEKVASNGSPFHQVTGIEQDVDVLVGSFAFTRKHLERMFALANSLGIHQMTNVRNGEDILLSFAGIRSPRVHNVGHIWSCASSSLPGVALWQTHQNFWEERISIFEKAQNARISMNDVWTRSSLLKQLSTLN
ncbi:glycosyltransferase family 2 protein [Tolypothrix sp. PCC 7910]|uniref:glycosyltransferase family A protein n=1 Tax=Tolypothrix sp. PCC 7910 TaxID=2099387 RepID=UPI00142799C7|nr:glycosyltransferase family A protein [Tolypothrix sp. PCC 7910]QIR37993.1 glycosyltransferase family 2 protein [Tolypothrix sp. PCC 7910]